MVAQCQDGKRAIVVPEPGSLKSAYEYYEIFKRKFADLETCKGNWDKLYEVYETRLIEESSPSAKRPPYSSKRRERRRARAQLQKMGAELEKKFGEMQATRNEYDWRMDYYDKVRRWRQSSG
jgi:hypothetical protein